MQIESLHQIGCIESRDNTAVSRRESWVWNRGSKGFKQETKPFMKAHGHVGVILVFAAAVALGGETNMPPLSRADREAIITAANQAVHQYMRSVPSQQRGMEIPRPLWGRAIERLEPLRVLHDRVNVFIVLQEDETTQVGLYVSIPISSYAPGHDERFLLFKDLTQPGDKAFGRIYECKMKKPQPTGGGEGKPTPQAGRSAMK